MKRKLIRFGPYSGLLSALVAGTFVSSVMAAELTDGEIRKVDKENQKITVKHGEIKNLDMPPMTMVFIFKDAAALEQLNAGDRIKFKAVKDGGKYTITEVQRQP